MLQFPTEPVSIRKCGFYIKKIHHFQPQQLNNILMPLKSAEYQVEIVNGIANITLLQTYQNPTQNFLELQYSFPINPNSCIYRFVAEFGNKKIEGIVKEKEKAREEYKEAIKNGKRAVLGQIDPSNKDILNLEIGNVGPNQIVKIQITYLQQLTLCSNMFYELHMIGSISPRYINFIPKEIIFHGFRNKEAKAKGKFYWNFNIIVRTSRKITFFDSRSHDIELTSQNDTQTESYLAMAKKCLPNKDFIFTYTTEDYQKPSYVLGRSDLSSTAMISFIPKFCQLNVTDAYKASVSGTPFETDIQNAKGEYIFLLDRSGSMQGKRIQKAKEALTLFIKSLPEDVYFNVMSFGSGSKTIFPNSVKYNDAEIKKAIKQIKSMKADMGGTEVYYPLNNLLRSKPIEGYPKQIFLLTDGAVGDTENILNMIEANNKYSRLHTIGIGNGASEELVTGCASKGKGHHVFISDDEDPSEKIIQLLTDSLSPVISKMKLTYDKNVVQSIIPNPQSLPYVLKGEIVNFYINFRGQLNQKTTVHFQYEDSLNKLPYASFLQIDPQTPSSSFIDRMGHFKKIQLLQSSLKNNSKIQDHMFFVKKVDKKAEVIGLSIKYQILSGLTSFISVEKELIDGKYEQIKNIGQMKVQIQRVEPAQYREQKCIMRSMNLANKKMKSISSNSNIKCMPQLKKCSMVMPTSASSKGMLLSKAPQPKKQMHIVSRNINHLKSQEKFQTKKQKKFAKKIQVQCQEQQQNGFQPSQKYKEQKSGKMTVSDVISYQLSDGSWNSVELIQKLFKKDTITLLGNPEKQMKIILITYLIVK